MFHKVLTSVSCRRSAHKPNEAFLRDFRCKYSQVAAIPYTLGAGIVPDQPAGWNPGVDTLPGIVSNPTLLPTPAYSSPPIGRRNCSCSVFNSRMCAVAYRTPAGDSPIQAQPWMPVPAYDMPQDLHCQGPVNSFSEASTHSVREISPPDSQIVQPSSMDGVQTAYNDHQTDQQTPRFHVTLHAPTATYNPARQIPVTYLNRRQGYKISIIDTEPPDAHPHPVRYRTHFRIAFEKEEQRADPVAAWRLWRDNRGLKEASRGDGQLRAVEFVDVMPNVIRRPGPESQVTLESLSLDGFSIVWLADPQSGHVGCEAHILFNFLSTDFTLSKGIQGAPLRLCTKTELISPDDIGHPGRPPEVSYCKIKLFRDHGSERKLANDTVQLRKAIDKIHQKLEQLEHLETDIAQGRLNPGKRKRGKPPAAARQHPQPCLTTTHDFSANDELRNVLSDLETVLSSSQPRSVLWLPADEQDDPDRCPIMLDPTPAHTGLGRTDTQLKSVSPTLIKGATQSLSPASTRMNSHAVHCNHTVACFYVLRRIDGKAEEYYYAVYVNERTQSDLVRRISQAYQLGSDGISHAVRMNAAGLRIAVDDDVVQEIPHGQDMVAELSPYDDQAPGSPPRFRVALFF